MIQEPGPQTSANWKRPSSEAHLFQLRYPDGVPVGETVVATVLLPPSKAVSILSTWDLAQIYNDPQDRRRLSCVVWQIVRDES